MRDDMAKVLVERPRRVWAEKRPGRTVSDELLPKRIGMRRGAQEAHGEKDLNENLAPLRRFLERQVGRPWNKVYSEIAANLKSNSTVQQHVRDHVEDFVQLHPHPDIRTHPVTHWRWRQPFYVDRRDGLLKRTARLGWAKADAKRSRPAAPDDRVSLRADLELRCLDGLWFEVRMAPLPAPEYRTVMRTARIPPGAPPHAKPREMAVRQLVTPAVHDIVSGRAVLAGPELDDPRRWAGHRKAHPSPTYAVSKRQLSRFELRQHGLANSAR